MILLLNGYDFLVGELAPLGVPIHAVTLSPALSVALTNRGTRALTEWERDRIPQLYAQGVGSPSFGRVLDNTHQTPEETAREILETCVTQSPATE